MSKLTNEYRNTEISNTEIPLRIQIEDYPSTYPHRNELPI